MSGILKVVWTLSWKLFGLKFWIDNFDGEELFGVQFSIQSGSDNLHLILYDDCENLIWSKGEFKGESKYGVTCFPGLLAQISVIQQLL